VATEPSHALTVAFNRKAGSVAEACRRQDIAFVPLAAVSLDGWHEVAVAQLDRLAAALSRYTGQPEEEASGGGGHLFGRLSVLLMRGNAALFSNRIPDHINTQDKRQIVDPFLRPLRCLPTTCNYMLMIQLDVRSASSIQHFIGLLLHPGGVGQT
jgi:hypothetical protein